MLQEPGGLQGTALRTGVRLKIDSLVFKCTPNLGGITTFICELLLLQ